MMNGDVPSVSAAHCVKIGSVSLAFADVFKADESKINEVWGCRQLAEIIATYPKSTEPADIELQNQADGLHLIWHRLDEAPLQFYIDVDKLLKQQHSYPAPKQTAFNRALGKKTKRVIDATGGWGGDALLMCTQGYQVTIIERHPIMAVMLSDAMLRLSQTNWATDNQVTVPTVIQADAIEFLNNAEAGLEADCVYCDPMFPPKRKKSAATNKNMQLLHWLLGEDLDAVSLIEAAHNSSVRRVAVKRPHYASPLYAKPSVQFSSKLVHYDVYISD